MFGERRYTDPTPLFPAEHLNHFLRARRINRHEPLSITQHQPACLECIGITFYLGFERRGLLISCSDQGYLLATTDIDRAGLHLMQSQQQP